MPIQPKLGHYYERRDTSIAGPATRHPSADQPGHYIWHVQWHTYTDYGRYSTCGSDFPFDLMKDLGTTDPRKPKKPRKAPAKKVRKVRMYFYRDGAGQLCASQWAAKAGWRHNASWGRYFSQIVSEPVPQKKKA